MELNIKKVNNGYILSWKEQDDEGTLIERCEVLEEQKFDGDSSLETKILLEFIANHFGYSYDRYGKNNLNITFDGLGHKVE